MWVIEVNICEVAANASNTFEKNNTELKRKYIKKNIDIINYIFRSMPGFCGSFGTGYPFYVLNSNMSGNLPIIEEQLRYNNELIMEANDCIIWPCLECLKKNSSLMPDLKQICKPCLMVKDSLKPRKVINRLPDIDMWMICEDAKVDEVKEKLVKIFNVLDMHTSDVDPVETIKEVAEISKDIEMGIMPEYYLPLDVHIIEYSKIKDLIEKVPFCLIDAYKNKKNPYLPIHPISLRKTWQYDDMAYNFILDYLFSLTPFNFENTLMEKLKMTRSFINNTFTQEQLLFMLDEVAPDSVKRRFENNELKKCYSRRIKTWKN